MYDFKLLSVVNFVRFSLNLHDTSVFKFSLCFVLARNKVNTADFIRFHFSSFIRKQDMSRSSPWRRV